MRYGYAVEYDIVDPSELDYTSESQEGQGCIWRADNLTSGYEEAASYGIVAGINAALKIKGRSHLYWIERGLYRNYDR